jgi:O-antigen ligase
VTIEHSGRPSLPSGAYLVRDVPRELVSPAVTALAVYTFLIIGRLPEILPSLSLFRPRLVVAIITIALASLLPEAHGPRLLQEPVVRTVLAMFVLAVMTVPFSVWPGASFDFVVNHYLKNVVFFLLLVYCVRSLPEVRRIIWAFFGAILTLGIGAFFSQSERVSVTGTYDTNDLAFVMVCAIPLATLWFFRGRPVGNYLARATAMLAILTIIRTSSRGGFAALVIVGALLLVRIPARQMLLRVAFLMGCILLFGVSASGAYWNRMATLWGGGELEALNEYDNQGIWAARWPLWKTGLILMMKNPLLGVGGGTFEIAEGISRGGVGKWSTAHNSFIQIGAELGVAGLGLFVFLLYRAVKNCRPVIRLARHDPELDPCPWLARGLEVSLYGYIVAGFSLSQGHSLSLYFLLGISVVLKRLSATPGRP